MTKAPSITISPDQIVSLLIGADSVSLRGFGGISAHVPFWVPTVNQFVLGLTPAAARQAARPMRLVGRAAATVAIVSSLILAFWAGNLVAVNFPSRVAMAPWSVKSVTPTGVIVGIGNTLMTVPVGAALPSPIGDPPALPGWQ